MRRPTRNLTIAIVMVAALVAFVPTILALSNCLGLSGTHKDWFVPVDAAALVQFSDHIVIVRYLDETFYKTPNSPHAHSDSPTSFIDVYRRFEVAQSLKGDFGPGDTVLVGWSRGYYERNEDEEGRFVVREAGPFSPGEAYALFLTHYSGRPHPDLAPGARVWQTRTGVGVARVDSQGRLSFETDAYYRAALKDLGLEPVPDSGAPFELTVAGVRALAEAQPP